MPTKLLMDTCAFSCLVDRCLFFFSIKIHFRARIVYFPWNTFELSLASWECTIMHIAYELALPKWVPHTKGNHPSFFEGCFVTWVLYCFGEMCVFFLWSPNRSYFSWVAKTRTCSFLWTRVSLFRILGFAPFTHMKRIYLIMWFC